MLSGPGAVGSRASLTPCDCRRFAITPLDAPVASLSGMTSSARPRSSPALRRRRRRPHWRRRSDPLKVVVRPNFDTLYSSAWLDLTREPMVVSVPDTHGRYYLLPMLGMWTDVFASPGWRTTGTQAGDYAVTPPGWSGSLPAGVVRIDAPTPYVWIIGRTKTDGPADYAAVNKLQAELKITPQSSWGKAVEPATGSVDPAIDMKTPPKITVDTMPAAKFFAYAAEILKLQPPHVTDEPILAQMRRIGIERGKSFDIDKVDPAIKAAGIDDGGAKPGVEGGGRFCRDCFVARSSLLLEG